MPTIIQGLSEIASRYDGYILDLWGVLHDGVQAFPEALACLVQLRARGARSVVLSNAPRRSAVVAARNAELGIAPELVDGVVSSGEVTWQHLAGRSDPWYRALGARCFHLGPERDRGMREGLDFRFVGAPEEADFILLTGILAAEDDLEVYRPLFTRALARRLPMVCANPDLEVIRGGKRELCAGSLARLYETMGGEMRAHGKPDPEVYEDCFAALGELPRERILAVGDALATDIAGAAAVGVDSLFVVEGIHCAELAAEGEGPLDRAALARLFDSRGLAPVATAERLRW
jgi:HAD superfamily hydrolase (TIGR01459 family)